MQIKPQALAQHLEKKLSAIYFLIGQDNYLLEDSLNIIKARIKKIHDCEEQILSIQSSDDWNDLSQVANSYSLFSNTVLLTIFYDKKSIDVQGKKILSEYLKAINSRCYILFRAPNVPAKQLQWLVNHDQVLLINAYPLTTEAMKSWIASQLKIKSLTFEPQIPEVIYQYTQGNMLACAQVIEKLSLSHAINSKIDINMALEHLSDQCDHSPFELVDACLMGFGDKAIQILRHAVNNKTEPTLILWMLTQEIRVHLQLMYLTQQKIDIKTAYNQLKIWPQRTSLYQNSIKRFKNIGLERLLHECLSIDEQIKSNLNTHIWNALERLALNLCLGK
ncbi:MAG: DNA polymerase III subunit delta [bacterium]|nr:DNA polymerase III subunit delta [bacterium]